MKNFYLFTLALISFSAQAFDFDWVNGLQENAEVGEIAVDQNGNVFAVTEFGGDIVLSKFDPSGNLLNSFTIGDGHKTPLVAVDDAGNVFVTGSFDAVTNFSPGLGTYNLDGDNALFLAKYDNSLNALLFAVEIPERRPFALHVASDGMVYMSVSNYSLQNQTDAYIYKFNGATGAVEWFFNLDIGGDDFIAVTGIDVSDNGELFISGSIDGTGNYPDFDPSPSTVFNNISGRIFFAKYDTDMNFFWAKGLDIPDLFQFANWYATTRLKYYDNKLVLTCQSKDTGGDIDPGIPVFEVDKTFFVAQYSAVNGSFIWGREIDAVTTGLNAADLSDLELDKENGYIYISGTHIGSQIDFDLTSANGLFPVSGGGQDGFVAVYDMSGSFLNAFTIPNTNSSWAYSIALYLNSLYVGGIYEGTADFDPTAGSFELTPNTTNPQYYVAKYTSELVTWIREDDATDGFEIYPNPSNGQFQVYGPDILECMVYDAMGRLVYSDATINGRLVIDLQNERAGVYTITVRADKGWTTHRIVKS